MEDNQKIWKQLLKAEQKARSSRMKRLIQQPFLYPALMLFDYGLYPLTQKGVFVSVNTFFGIKMKTLLPSGTDILLHEIKAHDSEIRFAKFMTRNLSEGEIFIDIGAHYGYYSLLALSLVGRSGHVYAIEASAHSAAILNDNVRAYKNITVLQAAASDLRGEVTFYEYPGPYAEANTTVKDAYQNQKWFQKIQQVENRVPTVVLDDLVRDKNISTAMFKIDAEGGEAAVLRGLASSLQEKDLVIVMEYLPSADEGSPHKEALRLFAQYGYQVYAIDADGEIILLSDVEDYFKKRGLDSDNLVFKKKLRSLGA